VWLGFCWFWLWGIRSFGGRESAFWLGNWILSLRDTASGLDGWMDVGVWKLAGWRSFKALSTNEALIFNDIGLSLDMDTCIFQCRIFGLDNERRESWAYRHISWVDR